MDGVIYSLSYERQIVRLFLLLVCVQTKILFGKRNKFLFIS